MATCLRVASTSVSRAPSLFSSLKPRWTRGIHNRKLLPYAVEDGLGKFLPPPALQTMVEYQDGLLERLNEELSTDPNIERHASVAQTVISYATRKERTLAFNYAVLALNNSFFLEQLAPPESTEATGHEEKMSVNLREAIRASYGDLVRIKSTFSASALGMFSNGWIWMVTDTAGNLGVLPTLGPSTLLVRSRLNMHEDSTVIGEDAVGSSATPTPSPTDKLTPPGLTPSFPTSGVSSPNFPSTSEPHSRLIHTSSRVSFDYTQEATSILDMKEIRVDAREPAKIPDMLNVGQKIYPLFCVPVYEHGWMSAGFGIWGKEEWLKEFWTVLDWGKVSNTYQYARNLKRDNR